MCGNIVTKRRQKVKNLKTRNNLSYSTTSLPKDFTPHSFNRTTLRKQIITINFIIKEKIIGKRVE